MLVTLIGISIIIFVLLRVVPGNIVDILFDAAGFVDPTDKANLEKELGLNLPIYNPNPKTWTEAFAIYAVPAMAVGFRSAALIMRITRSSMLEILRQDYIRTARAKGASEASVNYRHALKNAILPVITVIGIEAAFLIGGLIVTETVFNIPGVARFLVEALRWRDYPIVQNLAMLIGVVVVVA